MTFTMTIRQIWPISKKNEIHHLIRANETRTSQLRSKMRIVSNLMNRIWLPMAAADLR